MFGDILSSYEESGLDRHLQLNKTLVPAWGNLVQVEGKVQLDRLPTYDAEGTNETECCQSTLLHPAFFTD